MSTGYGYIVRELDETQYPSNLLLAEMVQEVNRLKQLVSPNLTRYLGYGTHILTGQINWTEFRDLSKYGVKMALAQMKGELRF